MPNQGNTSITRNWYIVASSAVDSGEFTCFTATQSVTLSNFQVSGWYTNLITNGLRHAATISLVLIPAGINSANLNPSLSANSFAQVITAPTYVIWTNAAITGLTPTGGVKQIDWTDPTGKSVTLQNGSSLVWLINSIPLQAGQDDILSFSLLTSFDVQA